MEVSASSPFATMSTLNLMDNRESMVSKSRAICARRVPVSSPDSPSPPSSHLISYYDPAIRNATGAAVPLVPLHRPHGIKASFPDCREFLLQVICILALKTSHSFAIRRQPFETGRAITEDALSSAAMAISVPY